MSSFPLSGFATRAIHAGYDAKANDGALVPPLHLSSTFVFETAEAGAEIFAGEREGYFYSRIANPTVDLLERRMAALEGAEAAVATASGMGAISAVFWSFLKPGDEIIVDQTLYGCTFAFMRHGLARFGVRVTHVDLTDPANLEACISDATKIVYFETPANPNMRLVDIAAVSAIARDHGARTVVDNTYATPVLTQPITLGADIVVHSATKYLGGHGDLVGGIALGTSADMQQVRLVGVKDMTGAVMAPFNPGLACFAQHDLARRQMPGFGGMIAFELKGGYAAGVAMMNRLTLVQRAVSLGDAESLIQHPASMTHSTYTAEERRAHGIADGLVRLSVGLEEADEIAADLTQALDAEVSASVDA